MKIYVSSTSIDLTEYRKAVITAIRKLQHTCIGMEDYGSENRVPVEKCVEDVSDCDVYVGIFAWRYGFIPDGYDCSITELEYREAIKHNIPTLIFLLDEEAAWSPKYIDRGEQRQRIESLRDELKKKHLLDFFNSPDDLRAKASQAIAKLPPIITPPPIDITLPPLPPKVSLSRLPTTGAAKFGREQEIKLLDEAWENERTNIVTLVAWGGVGKSSLINSWLAHLAKENFRGAKSVFGWSFYNQESDNPEASADVFTAEALSWFGDPHPNRGSPWEKGQRLVELVRRQKTLFILDGLEVLQHLRINEGKLKDQALQSLLMELAWQNPGLCLISTRIQVADLQSFLKNTVEEILLSHLPPEAGAELLASLGVTGTKTELRQAAKEFKGHALALTLLGSYLVEFRDGDIRWWREIGEEGDQARRVMSSYEQWLGKGVELDILKLLGLFDGPVHWDALKFLCNPPIIEGLTENLIDFKQISWNQAINKLRRLKLVAEKNQERPDILDTHPLVRQHFSQQLQSQNPEAWEEANNRLFNYYKSLPKSHLPDNLNEMSPLFQAVVHGCRAKRHQETWDEVYWTRIRREDDGYSVLALNAYGADLVALSGFFDECWNQPVKTLNEETIPLVLTETAFDLRGLGRLSESVSAEYLSLNALRKNEKWITAGNSAGNLSETLLTMGDLNQATEIAKLSIELAEKSGDKNLVITNIATLADTLHQKGEFELAEKYFKEAEDSLIKHTPSVKYLHALRGYHFCDLLLSQGNYEEVFPRAENSLQVDEKRPYAVGLAHLAMARAHILKAQVNQTNDFAEAAKYMEQAIYELRLAGHQELVVRGLLASAELNRLSGIFDEAKTNLKESQSTAIRGQMGLHQADAFYQYAHLYLALSQIDLARENLEKSKSKINSTGYYRRSIELDELETKIRREEENE